MNIHFFLSDKARETTSIILVVSHKGKYYRKSTGLTCKTIQWSKSKEKSGHIPTDKKLGNIKASLLSDLDEFSPPADITKAIDRALNGDKPQPEKPKIEKTTPTFWEFFDEWAERDSPNKRQRKLSRNNIERVMGSKITWNTIDIPFYTLMVRKMQDKGWSQNYIGGNIKHLKAMMHEAYNLGYHTNGHWKDLHKIAEDTDNIYLTADEMERLWTCELPSEMLRKARDLAWLGYLTCARFSDYSRLSEESIGRDGMIRFSQQKTSRAVVLPCSPRVREILARNGGKAPKLCQQNFNDAIKDACRIAGITDKVEHIVSKGTRHIREVVDKCDLVSSHTFRRSAATNLYLQGVSLRSIMQLTGHSSIAMLEKYLKVGGEENASRLADNPFFK